ncbi:hypothetical protein IAG25_32905 [Caballeronia sp. EK]|uniref:hypothetical protein n=1 Tax=Caballeronia sp. EK TaxID=2767469 RepID=UPI0016556B98|nr:hypothetical protein [Caballeronia sp. EK]MBC8641626.1 hypothetical protein [Caballeronia sp. EK]
MASSFSLLLNARVSLAIFHFAQGPTRLLYEAEELASQAGAASAMEGDELKTPHLFARTGASADYDIHLDALAEHFRHGWRTHAKCIGEYFSVTTNGLWVRIKSLERDGAHGSITLSQATASQVFRRLAQRPSPYGLWRNYILTPGAYLLRVDDPEASSYGQLMLQVGQPAQGGIFFGNPATEHLHISALLALEGRVSALFGPSPLLLGHIGSFDGGIWTKRGRISQLLAQLGAPAYAAMNRIEDVGEGKARIKRDSSRAVIRYRTFNDRYER